MFSVCVTAEDVQKEKLVTDLQIQVWILVLITSDWDITVLYESVTVGVQGGGVHHPPSIKGNFTIYWSKTDKTPNKT